MRRLLICLALLIPAPLQAAERPTVRVGSKAFSEGVTLGEMLCHLVAVGGGRPVHLSWLGDTSKVWNGLLDGSIDAYCEYTGTLTRDILEDANLTDEGALRAALETRGIRMSQPLGFNNTYAIAMRADRAKELNIERISDLKEHRELKLGLSNPFLNRRDDGWPGLKARYGLPFDNLRGLDHALVYDALKNGTLDVTDIYSTDAKIATYDLKLLKDDLHFFPTYNAVILYRADLEARAPEVVHSMLKLEYKIDDRAMTELNLRVQNGESEIRATANFLNAKLGLPIEPVVPTMWQDLVRWTSEHLFLVTISLAAGIVIAIPLGVAAARVRWLGQPLLAVIGLVQTVPALALLYLLSVSLHQLGVVPALVALFCYSLLPIVRNTYTGLKDIPIPIRESAEALGLSPFARLRLIEMPLAARSILAGIKTAAVINVGNATLGGLIAAGGYGTPIIIGLNKNNVGLILQGAIPAVLMALAIIVLFEIVERFSVSPGLRLKS
jgi:osmoprotectant transport system permease protein